MNALRFKHCVVLVITIYTLAVISMVGLAAGQRFHAYNTLKDTLPLIIAIPAAWLGYWFQRRQAYLRDVRDLWSKLVDAEQAAIQYTHLTSPLQSDFANTLKTLSTTIEEIRAVFSNVSESEGEVGLYPIERLKEMHSLVSSLSFGSQFSPAQAALARMEIVNKWKLLRKHYLSELERGIPANPDIWYLK